MEDCRIFTRNKTRFLGGDPHPKYGKLGLNPKWHGGQFQVKKSLQTLNRLFSTNFFFFFFFLNFKKTNRAQSLERSIMSAFLAMMGRNGLGIMGRSMVLTNLERSTRAGRTPKRNFRGLASSKLGNKNFYKSRGAPTYGTLSSKGRFKLDK